MDTSSQDSLQEKLARAKGCAYAFPVVQLGIDSLVEKISKETSVSHEELASCQSGTSATTVEDQVAPEGLDQPYFI